MNTSPQRSSHEDGPETQCCLDLISRTVSATCSLLARACWKQDDVTERTVQGALGIPFAQNRISLAKVCIPSKLYVREKPLFEWMNEDGAPTAKRVAALAARLSLNRSDDSMKRTRVYYALDQLLPLIWSGRADDSEDLRKLLPATLSAELRSGYPVPLLLTLLNLAEVYARLAKEHTTIKRTWRTGIGDPCVWRDGGAFALYLKDGKQIAAVFCRNLDPWKLESVIRSLKAFDQIQIW